MEACGSCVNISGKACCASGSSTRGQADVRSRPKLRKPPRESTHTCRNISWTREIGLLRQRNSLHILSGDRCRLRRLTQYFFREKASTCAREGGRHYLSSHTRYHAFTELTDCLLDRLPAMERGAIYADIQAELLNLIEDYVGREPSYRKQGSQALVAHFEKWFADKTSPRRVFVPCAISRHTRAPLRDRTRHVRVYRLSQQATSVQRWRRRGLGPGGSQFRAMDARADADWLARVSVDGCEQKRAEEIAEPAVDLVIVAVQLAAPYPRHAHHGTA